MIITISLICIFIALVVVIIQNSRRYTSIGELHVSFDGLLVKYMEINQDIIKSHKSIIDSMLDVLEKEKKSLVSVAAIKKDVDLLNKTAYDLANSNSIFKVNIDTLGNNNRLFKENNNGLKAKINSIDTNIKHLEKTTNAIRRKDTNG